MTTKVDGDFTHDLTKSYFNIKDRVSITFNIRC